MEKVQHFKIVEAVHIPKKLGKGCFGRKKKKKKNRKQYFAQEAANIWN